MASINDSHADSDTYAMDIAAPRLTPFVPAQASAVGPELSINPSIPKRISRSEWAQHEPFIRFNYHRMELKELRKLILKEHGFVARWNLSKSIPKPVAKFMVKKAQLRQIEEGKKTSFRYRRQPVPNDKIKRYTQEYADGALSPIASSPSNLTYNTLKSPHMKHSIPDNYSNRNDMSVRAEFYNGQDVDGFLTVSRNAQTLIEHDDYPGAKLAFIEALEGLEALLGSTNKIVIDVLLRFVDVAIENKDLDGAMEQLRKSYTHHQELLGDNHKKTWLSFSRLGLVYAAEKKHGQALKTFTAARDGLHAASETSSEDMFNLTLGLKCQIVDACRELGDFESAEEELCDLIRQSEGLGGTYRDQIAYFKHQLAHLYTDKKWQAGRHPLGSADPPRHRVEKLLLEAVHDYALTFNEGPFHLCTLEQLRRYYETTGELHKLSTLVREKIEPILSTIRSTEDDCAKVHDELTVGVISSLSWLCEYEKADWWLQWRQQQIENASSDGYYSLKALSNLMMHARSYLDRSLPQFAEPLLEKAQRIARKILPPDHDVHKTIAETIANKAWMYRTCNRCLVNPPGNDVDDSK
ncbi:hypothetical protein BM1_08875 [Bipolaris maydis]|nr:hypothetical protein BM1_08875 [Bipolaris maydis]